MNGAPANQGNTGVTIGNSSGARVVRAELMVARCALTRPYDLSFVTLNEYVSVMMRVTLDNGDIGLGECVPLPGYSHETVESVLNDLKAILEWVTGRSCAELRATLPERLADSPFAMSAVLTAVDTALVTFPFPPVLSVPMLHPLSARSTPEQIVGDLQQGWDDGFRTFKLKVGRDVSRDCSATYVILDRLPEGGRLRIDANQGYTPSQARQLADAVRRHPRRALVEVLEQPLEIAAWDEFEALVSYAPDVPWMLDESIVFERDVQRAAAAGARIVKLKLFKHAGITGLLDMARHAADLGLKVVVGNGVATDVGNLAEALAVHHGHGLFLGACEGNGFAKLQRPLLLNGPVAIKGTLQYLNGGMKKSRWALREGTYELFEKGEET